MEKLIGHYGLLEKEMSVPLFDSYRGGDIQTGFLEEHLRIDLFAPGLALSDSVRQHWPAHAQAVADLNHPNILRETTLDIEGHLLAIYPYFDSFSLGQMFANSKREGIPFSLDHALLIVGKIAAAVGYAANENRPHHLVVPPLIQISSEGDLKIRGFSVSQVMRDLVASEPKLATLFHPYFPKQQQLGDGSLERYNLFAIGSIFYEMLMGEAFYESGPVTDVTGKVKNARIMMTDDPIPPGVADVLVKTLDPQVQGAFQKTPELAEAMDKILFSGDYSPTTFNLAFFMHQAFRDEIDARTKALKAEKQENFTDLVLKNQPDAVPPSLPKTGTHEVTSTPTASSPKVRPAQGRSKLPLVIGGLATVVALVVIGFLALGKDDSAKSKREQQRLALQRTTEEQSRSAEQFQESVKDAEIKRLQKLLEEKLREELAESEQLDEELDSLKVQQAEKAQKEKEAAAERAKEQEELQKREKEMQRLREQIAQLQREKEAEIQAAKVEPVQETQKTPVAKTVNQQPPSSASDETAETAAVQFDADVQAAAPSSESKPAQEQAKEPTATTPSVSTPTTVPRPMPVATTPKGILSVYDCDNAADLERPLNARNSYTPSRGALRAGILTNSIYTYPYEIVIDVDGSVVDFKLEHNPLQNLANDHGMKERADQTIERLRFEVPIKNGKPVKAYKKEVLVFARM